VFLVRRQRVGQLLFLPVESGNLRLVDVHLRGAGGFALLGLVFALLDQLRVLYRRKNREEERQL
jgi:hypothetical protein